MSVLSCIYSLKDKNRKVPEIVIIEKLPTDCSTAETLETDEEQVWDIKNSDVAGFANIYVGYAATSFAKEKFLELLQIGGISLKNAFTESGLHLCICSFTCEVVFEKNFFDVDTFINSETTVVPKSAVERPMIISILNDTFLYRPYRFGVNYDEEKIDRLSSYFNTDALHKTNLKKEELNNLKEDLMKKWEENEHYDSIILFISSHGYIFRIWDISWDGIYLSDETHLSFQELLGIFSLICPRIPICIFSAVCQVPLGGKNNFLYAMEGAICEIEGAIYENRKTFIDAVKECFPGCSQDFEYGCIQERFAGRAIESLPMINFECGYRDEKFEFVLEVCSLSDTEIYRSAIKGGYYVGNITAREVREKERQFLDVIKNSFPGILHFDDSYYQELRTGTTNKWWQLNNLEFEYRDNIFLFVAAFLGTCSFRHSLDGTYFIHEIMKCIPGSPHFDQQLVDYFPQGLKINQLANEVTKFFLDEHYEENGIWYQMLPCVMIDTMKSELLLKLPSAPMLENLY